MTRFSATTRSEVAVAVERSAVWAALVNPQQLTELNPLIERIDTDGDLWQWHLKKIAALGVAISPSFTERMSFVKETRIDFEHEPPPGVTERSGASGSYVIDEVEDGTTLRIDLTVTIELPLPRAAGPAVRKVMKTTMSRTGERFTDNLQRHLGS